MTIVNSASADAFIGRLPKDLRFFLIHGEDEGLTYERARALALGVLGGEHDALRMVRLDGDDVAREPEVLTTEAYAIPMFGGTRVIWIDARNRDLMPALTPLFENPPTDCVVLVKAGQLRKGTSVRSAFEQLRGGVSIECYADQAKSLETVINSEARAAGVAMSPEARSLLIAMLGADRLTTRGELTKLMLYVRGRARIDCEDVEAVVSDAAPSRQDGLIDAALKGELHSATVLARQHFSEGGDGDEVVSRLTGRLMQLYRVRLHMDEGRGFEAACETLHLRLPINARRALAELAERWTSEPIRQQTPAILGASGKIRSEPRLAFMLASRALWALAARSRSRRR